MEIILDNLLSNAVKYSEPQTEIYLTVDIIDKKAVMKFRDKGRGIPEEYLKLKDKRFHRAGNVRGVEGLGLGLSIVERNVKLHNGKKDIERVVGHGTVVTVEIPLADSVSGVE